jgi:hypothetical protein
MSDRVVVLLAIYGFCVLLALMARYVAFGDRPDLAGLAWWPPLIAAVVVTPFALWVN